MKPSLPSRMLRLFLLLSVPVLLTGCPKKENKSDAPTPQGQLVGRWEMVSYIVSPPENGIADLLAYLRQLYMFNCSDINFYYELYENRTFKTWTEMNCNGRKTVDIEEEFNTWSVNGNKLTVSGAGGKQEFTYTYKPGVAGKKDTQMTLETVIDGHTYTSTFNKL
ncbi:lipocalin-like domain-containing protein [Larkinella soli]|uniref:lipocalin family protein n=1 Tax=Larkinella soli TaxID=1770527 RepID=UPI000FFC6F18|nr:lipocalin family protein [Larkinella soli]